MCCETTVTRRSCSCSAQVRAATAVEEAELVAKAMIVTETSQGVAGVGGAEERGNTVTDGLDMDNDEC
jgi:hypothetical protein